VLQKLLRIQRSDIRLQKKWAGEMDQSVL
jgi:hypothetical protein